MNIFSEGSGGPWKDSHTECFDEEISNDEDQFFSDEYYKHCGTFLDRGKLHTYLPQHFDSHSTSTSLSAGTESLNENKSFPCDTCGKVYKLYSSLYSHKKYECGKVPAFKCPFCPQRTYQKGSMKRHMKRIHNSHAPPLIVPEADVTV